MATLSWELYGAGSQVGFRAASADNGYSLAVTRDGVRLISESGLDGAALLRRSQQLRRSFQNLGYTAMPRETDPALRGGPCWGPGSLIPASVLIASAASSRDYGDPMAVVELGLGYEVALPSASLALVPRTMHRAAA